MLTRGRGEITSRMAPSSLHSLLRPQGTTAAVSSGPGFNTRLDDPLKHPSRCPSRERPCTNFFPLPLDGKSKRSFWIEKRLRGTFSNKKGSFIQYKRALCWMLHWMCCWIVCWIIQTRIESGPRDMESNHWTNPNSLLEGICCGRHLETSGSSPRSSRPRAAGTWHWMRSGMLRVCPRLAADSSMSMK